MWCRHCKQETPADGPAGEYGPRCGRCQRTSPPEATPTAASGPASPSGIDVAPPGPHEDEDSARRAIYRRLRSAHAAISAGDASRTLRLDVGRSPLVEAVGSPASASQPATPMRRPVERVASPPPTLRRATQNQTAAWLMTALGAVVLGFGIGLAGWSQFGQRVELWNGAIAATLIGQGLLVIGLAQLVASLWSATRHAATKLAAMHDDLRRLRRLADESAGRHAPSAAGFYADLARDAPPERMLGNLRGQLDELAARLR